MVGLPGVMESHASRSEEARAASPAGTPDTPGTTAVEVTKPSTVVADAVAPLDNTAVERGHPRTVVDDVMENVRQLLDSLSHADRCRVLGIDTNGDSRPCTTVAVPGCVYIPIPSVPTGSTGTNVETGADKFIRASETNVVNVGVDVPLPQVRLVSSRETTSLTGSDTDGDEALALALCQAEIRAAARRREHLPALLKKDEALAERLSGYSVAEPSVSKAE